MRFSALVKSGKEILGLSGSTAPALSEQGRELCFQLSDNLVQLRAEKKEVLSHVSLRTAQAHIITFSSMVAPGAQCSQSERMPGNVFPPHLSKPVARQRAFHLEPTLFQDKDET